MEGPRVRERLREWVVARSGRIRAEDLRDDTPILEQRIITSLQIPELMLLIEELSGRPVDASRLKPGAFRDIATIERNFFGDPS